MAQSAEMELRATNESLSAARLRESACARELLRQEAPLREAQHEVTFLSNFSKIFTPWGRCYKKIFTNFCIQD